MQSSFRRDESRMHMAPSVVIMTMPILILALVVSLIVAAVQAYTGGGWMVALIIAAICLSWGIFCDMYFSFNENCRIKFTQKYIEYEYDLNSQVIASSNKTVRIRISSLRNFKVRGRYIIFYGDIVVDKVFKKREEVRKIKVPINFSDKADILLQVSEFKERSLSK